MVIFILNASLALYVSFGYFYIHYSVFQNKKGYLFIYGGAQYACGGQKATCKDHSFLLSGGSWD